MADKSVSGEKALPKYEARKKMTDMRAKVEREVARAWAQMNVRKPFLNGGSVIVDDLCPKTGKNGKALDANALMAVNSTIQWLFGTNVGRAIAEQLLRIEREVHDQAKEVEELRTAAQLARAKANEAESAYEMLEKELRS